MRRGSKKDFSTAVGMLAAFVLWTVALRLIDVQPIGPQGSAVGFAELNRFVHQLTGVHSVLYTITDWLSLIPVLFVAGFAFLGLLQWIRRRKLEKVDSSLLMLGGFYLVVAAIYVFFEIVVINERPVLIDGGLEASYPSSTTVLVLCVMPTAAMQMKERVRNPLFKRCLTGALSAFAALMTAGRLVSGVHWFSDIAGGVLLSAGLVMLYRFACGCRKC